MSTAPPPSSTLIGRLNQCIDYPWGGTASHPTTREQVKTAVAYWKMAMYRLYPDSLLCTFLENAGFRIWHRSVHHYQVSETGYTDMLILIEERKELSLPQPSLTPSP